ncbi:MAG: hypothetical protein U0821_03135 [Chloroflexota bacterium]
MVVDAQGGVWLVNEWLALAVGVLAVSIFAYCHAWMAAERNPFNLIVARWPRQRPTGAHHMGPVRLGIAHETRRIAAISGRRVVRRRTRMAA